MANENALSDARMRDGELADFNELEEKLYRDLELQLSDLSLLEEEIGKIGNLDSLGKVVKDAVWEQFLNQIGVSAGEEFIEENRGLTLDLRDEAHIQTAENFAEGKIATHNSISREQLEQNYDRYTNVSHKQFRKDYVEPGMDATLKRAGALERDGIDTVPDVYSGRQIPTKKKLENGRDNPNAAQREHVKPSAELYKNPSLQMANSSEELAGIINSPENLQGYTTAKRNNRKSDNSPDEMSRQDKNKHWEKANERAEKYVAGEEQRGAARLKKEGRQTQRAEALHVGGKSLQAAFMTLLAGLVKEVIGKLVKWLRSTDRKVKSLLNSLKEAIQSFVRNLKSHLINAADSALTTIATAILGPIMRIVKKVWTLLRQAWNSIKEAIAYIKNPENRSKPIGLMVLEIGKIVTAGLAAGGAILLGEAIEKGLIAIPGAGAVFAFEIPLLGSLASILGIFFGAVIAGIIGAIVINIIDRAIARHKKAQLIAAKVEKGNEVLSTQAKILEVNQATFIQTQQQVASSMQGRHREAAEIIAESASIIFSNEGKVDNNRERLDEIDSKLEELLGW